MRILFVTPQPPHPTNGGAAIRNWHLIDAARRAGHEVDVLTFGLAQLHDGTIASAPEHPTGRRALAARISDLLLDREPDLAHRLGARALRGEIEKLTQLRQYDLVQVEGLEMWPSLPRMAIPAVYDAHNAETTLQRRIARRALRDGNFPRALYSFVQARKLRAYEAGVVRHAAATIAVSPVDAEALERLASGHRVDVAQIGVDTAHYAPCGAPAPEIAFDALFTGTMAYRANADAAHWFIRAVWPRIRAVKPDARLGIVGRGAPATLRRLSGQGGIHVVGAVDDDRPYMAGARVYVLPIRFGAGVRVKLLNAMSMGCAVVATPAACEGVAVADGTHLVTANTDGARFAAATTQLLDDPERRRRLGAAARAHMRAVYDWSLCTPALLAIYARLERGHA